MKKFLSIILCIIITVSIPVTVFAQAPTIYYIDSVAGDDADLGTSESTAWKTTSNIDGLKLKPGDKILFKRGGTYECTITLTCEGTPQNPIVISAYGEGERPHLTTDKRDAIMRIFDCSYVTISGFELTAHNGGGIWVDALTKPSYGVKISDCIFHDMQNHTVTKRDSYWEGPISGRAAVVVKRYGSSVYPVNDFTVENCEIYDCGNGVFFTGHNENRNRNGLVKNCYIHDLDGEAVVLEACENTIVTHCRMIDCCQGEGVDENGKVLYYIAAAWFHYSDNCTIEYCEIAGQKNIGDGMTVDFDHYSTNCTYQYIYSHDNMRFMVNNGMEGSNYGNTVRYCLSVNDYSEGRVNRMSGNGEYDFKFYNNTIVGCGRINFDDIYDSLVVNNIFVSASGTYCPIDIFKNAGYNNTFSNNCYYNMVNVLSDIGSDNLNPGFSGDDYSNIESFMLSFKSPLIGKGYKVNDGITKDFFGNEITSTNIGCYGGSGTDAEYDSEFFISRIFRIVKQFFNALVMIIKYDIN